MNNNLKQDIKELTREELERLLLEQTEQVDYCYKRIEELHNTIDKAIEYINHAQNYGTMAQIMPHLKPYVNGNDLLQILGDKENE